MVVIKDIDGEVIREFPELDTLAGADLSYEDLMFADFRGMDLEGTRFEGADLRHAEFDDDVLSGFGMIDPPDFTNTCYEKIRSSVGPGGRRAHFRGW